MHIVALLHIAIGLCVIVISILSMVPTLRTHSFFRLGASLPSGADRSPDDIDRHMGRLFLIWGILVFLLGAIGFRLSRLHWAVYDIVSSTLILVGIGVLVSKAMKYSGRRSSKAL